MDDTQNNLEITSMEGVDWPRIGGEKHNLADKLKEMGFIVEKIGRSGFDTRNSYKIKTADEKLTPEALTNVEQAIKKVKEIEKQENEDNFKKIFNNNTPDANKTYAVVATGGYNQDISVPEGYNSIAEIRTACTADHRLKLSHTYDTLFINEEAMKKDKRRQITLFVPKEMIGMIIGKGGSQIKALGQKYGKYFKVEQDPRERSHLKASEIKSTFYLFRYTSNPEEILGKIDISLASYPELNEQDRKEVLEYIQSEMHEREIYQQKKQEEKHQEDLRKLEHNITEHFGTNLLTTDDIKLAEGIAKYLKENNQTLPVIPTTEELNQINENIKSTREDKRREEAANREWEINNIKSAIRSFIADNEKEGEIIPSERVEQFVREQFPESAYAEQIIEESKNNIQRRQKKAAAKIKAVKNFNKVAAEEFAKFYDNYEDSGPHKENYFDIVGRSRRSWGYSIIAYRTGKRLGILENSFDDVNDYENPEYKDFMELREKIEEFNTPASFEEIQNYLVNGLPSEQVEEESLEDIPEVKLTKEEMKEIKKASKSKGQKIQGGLSGLAALLKDDKSNF